jgi:peroxiredoxin
MFRRVAMCLSYLVFIIVAGTISTYAADRPSPDFSFKDSDGHETRLSAYRGKVVILAFINTECPHCQRVSKMLSTIQTSYGAEKLQVLGVAINEEAEKLLPTFKANIQPMFPVGAAPEASVQSYLAIPPTGLIYTPVVVVIDREGVIRAENAGHIPMVDDEQALRRVVDQLLTVSTHD